MADPKLTLHGYWRSSASWRVRWALALKEVPYLYAPVNILEKANRSPEHLKRNPLGALPVLEVEGKGFLSESLAIIDWIDETFDQGDQIYPSDPWLKAQSRALAEMINSGTAPLQTPRAQNRHSADPKERAEWGRHFVREGLAAFDAMAKPLRGRFSVGDTVTVADLFLVPQLYNARRFEIDVAKEFPALELTWKHAMATDACQVAAPENQNDAVKT